MADLIDRQKAIDATKKQIMLEYVWATEDGDAETEAVESLVEAICKQTKRAIEEEIEELPTIDAVPVVRCKDCENFQPGKDEWGACSENPLKMWRKTDFCSWGERREMDGGDDDADGA